MRAACHYDLLEKNPSSHHGQWNLFRAKSRELTFVRVSSGKREHAPGQWTHQTVHVLSPTKITIGCSIRLDRLRTLQNTLPHSQPYSYSCVFAPPDLTHRLRLNLL